MALGLENYTMTDGARRRVDYFPKYIYYCASEEEITNFRSKYSLFDDTNLTPEGRFLLSKSSETVSKVEAIQDKMDALGDDLKAEMRKEIAELRELVKTLLVRSGDSTSPTKRDSVKKRVAEHHAIAMTRRGSDTGSPVDSST
jgi:hypothetical protein